MKKNKRSLLHAILILLFLIYIGLPANAGIQILNGLSHEFSLGSGETKSGQIEVQNTRSIRNVKAYLRDYKFRYTGEAFYEEPGTYERSNASWITVTPNFFPLDSSQTSFINFQINVPNNGSLHGTYWSVIMVEEVEPISDSSLKRGITINTVIRYAVQISVTIGNKGTKDLKFTDMLVKKEGGKRILQLNVENNGEVFLRPHLSMEMYDQTGNKAGTFTTNKRRTYPGTSVRFEIDISSLKPGSYEALILADCSEEDVFGINLTVEITDD
jgi:hypothetical protein